MAFLLLHNYTDFISDTYYSQNRNLIKLMLTNLLKEFHAHYNKKSTFLHVFFGYLCFLTIQQLKTYKKICMYSF